jgi:phosphatidate phosphatase APP1
MSLIEDFLRRATDSLDQGINVDEFVVFYPSIGIPGIDAADCRIEIRGRIYEERQILRELPAIALALAGVSNAKELENLLGPLAHDANCIRIFNERVRDFVLDGERNEQFDIDLSGTRLKGHHSNRQGFFGLGEPWYTVPRTEVVGEDSPWIRYTATGEKARAFQGKSQLLRPRGVIVVSDIDDTIKDSNVPELVELTLNTLFRPFRSTPRMAEIYREWQENNAQFIYLTNSPYQLFRPLVEYLQGEAGYPEGAYYMRYVEPADLRQKISKLVAIDHELPTQENPKKHNLIPILEAFPESSFVLVGDSTEHDAAIYTDLYLGQNFPAKFSHLQKAYKDRIKKIYIRDVTNSKRRREAAEAFARVGNEAVTRVFNPQNPDIGQDAVSVFQESVRRRGASV